MDEWVNEITNEYYPIRCVYLSRVCDCAGAMRRRMTMWNNLHLKNEVDYVTIKPIG